jgi:hypothetical protein
MEKSAGRRIPVVDPEASPLSLVREPGDYYGPVQRAGEAGPTVIFRLPDSGRLAHITSPPFEFTENADGTLSVQGSILCRWTEGDESCTWHGHLTNGEWHRC